MMKRSHWLLLTMLGLLLATGVVLGDVALVRAQGGQQIETEVLIPGAKIGITRDAYVRGVVRDLAEYMDIVYTWLVSIVGIVAAVMIMLGGFQYLTAGGDAERAQRGKGRVANALLGLILAFTSYLLLNTINPGLVNFKVPELAIVEPELIFLPWCDEMKGEIETVRTGRRGCGELGKFRIADNLGLKDRDDFEDEYEGKEFGYCVYREGGCGEADFIWGVERALHKERVSRSVFATCFQKNYAPSELEEVARRRDRAAECITCQALSGGKMIEFGYGVSRGACHRWEYTANFGPLSGETFKDQAIDTKKKNLGFDAAVYFAHYCDYSPRLRTCVQVDNNCQTDQDAVSIFKGEVGRKRNRRIDECEHYEDQYAVWGASLQEAHFMELGAATGGLPAHLLRLCEANPCAENWPRGCERDGTIRDLTRFLTTGSLGTKNCTDR